ncbi:MAG: hypothetical protein JRI49_00045 [Deltaproteobacteria bacterium]|nr:hypothetical protein [Deltaproteobacteria bacterium]
MMKKSITGYAMISLVVFFLCCSVSTVSASNFLSKLDAGLSEFNPIGHHLVDPINEAVPRLHLSGFIRLDANLNVHGDDHSVGFGNIKKDWRAQKIEWLMELEASYKLTDNWELCAVTHFLYDTAYDWQHSRGLYADRTDRTSHYYHKGEQILREFYLKGFWGNFDFYLGKQQVVWGKMEGKILDIVNPEDTREHPPAYWQDDYEYRRIPLWMANITYHWSDYSLQLLWIPDFEESYGPTLGSAYFPPFISIPSIAAFDDSDKPSHAFKDHEWALRFNMTKGRWEYSLVYFYTWSDGATNFKRNFRMVPLRHGLINLVVEPKYTRLHQFGGNVETAFYWLGRHWTVSNEILYTMNRYYSVDDESLFPFDLGDGVVNTDDIMFGSRWLTTFFDGELVMIVQPLIKYIFGFERSFSTSGSDQEMYYGALVVLSKSYEFTANRLNTTYYMVGLANMNPSQSEGWRHLLEIRWKVSNYISTKLYYEWYNGDHMGVYGAYDKHDNVGLYIKYEF